MKLSMFSVRDSASQAFGRPFYAPHAGVALRSFGDECNNPESDFNHHPEDYELFELGVFDDSDASFEIYSKPKPLGVGKQFLKPVVERPALVKSV